jgi:hypothetical protein
MDLRSGNNAETPYASALSAAVPEASAGPGAAIGAELGSVPEPVSGLSLIAPNALAARGQDAADIPGAMP